MCDVGLSIAIRKVLEAISDLQPVLEKLRLSVTIHVLFFFCTIEWPYIFYK